MLKHVSAISAEGYVQNWAV